jgi:predicted outer membrane repeat protein
MPRTAALALLLASGAAHAQSYYLDFDRNTGPGAGLPAVPFGGPAGLVGAWRSISSTTPLESSLFATDGLSYGATLVRDADGAFTGFDNANTSGHYESFFDDYQELADGTLVFTFNNLAPATYAVYTAAVHPGNAANRTTVVLDNPEESCQISQSVGGAIEAAASGRSVLRAGVTHALHVKRVIAGYPLIVRVSDGFQSTAVINGIQLVRLPGPRLRMYVKANAAGANDGSSWDNAFTDLQFALDAAHAAGGLNSEIWVAAGIYTPTDGTDRTATFSVADGLHIYGGFAGTETDLSQRTAPLSHGTYLSGAIGGSASTDNSYNVVTLDNVGSNTLVDGFYIARGYCNGGPWNGHGGGMVINYATSPTVRNCDFTTNTASLGGAALYLKNATTHVINCTFYRGDVDNGAGGAIESVGPIQTTLTLQNSRFLGNHALGDGGAIYTNFVHADIANCIFSGNSSDNEGGAIKSVGDTQSLRVVNCTFSRNTAGDNAGGIYVSGGLDVELHNSILWGNTGGLPNTLPNQQISVNTGSGSTLTASFNTIQGQNGDPLFVNAAGADGIPGNFDDDCHLLQGSPAVDYADAAQLPQDIGDVDDDGDAIEQIPLDLDGQPRRIDIPSSANTGLGLPPLDRGCYELQLSQWCFANCDNSAVAPVLNVNDFVCFQSRFASASPYADCDHSGTLNVNDFVCFQSAFAAGCP